MGGIDTTYCVRCNRKSTADLCKVCADESSKKLAEQLEAPMETTNKDASGLQPVFTINISAPADGNATVFVDRIVQSLRQHYHVAFVDIGGMYTAKGRQRMISDAYRLTKGNRDLEGIAAIYVTPVKPTDQWNKDD